MILDLNFTDGRSRGSNWQYSSIGSDNGLAPGRQFNVFVFELDSIIYVLSINSYLPLSITHRKCFMIRKIILNTTSYLAFFHRHCAACDCLQFTTITWIQNPKMTRHFENTTSHMFARTLWWVQSVTNFINLQRALVLWVLEEIDFVQNVCLRFHVIWVAVPAGPWLIGFLVTCDTAPRANAISDIPTKLALHLYFTKRAHGNIKRLDSWEMNNGQTGCRGILI